MPRCWSAGDDAGLKNTTNPAKTTPYQHDQPHSLDEATTVTSGGNVDAKRITLYMKLIAAQKTSKAETFTGCSHILTL
ncbi:hypothetical protein GJ744_008078 [Endocarpon pusillum]|uniref:Uncharacterized protein n=1 Tax=Endocarpon pusillum TaxID=364733 RepID=A0A8H7AHS5_9EURO|nr:hypothetical protein GJ744_008078 [Endocarpon pusillum]